MTKRRSLGLGFAVLGIGPWVYPMGLLGLLPSGTVQAQPAKVLPPDAARCPATVTADPTLRSDYARRVPQKTKVPADAAAASGASIQKAREAHLRGNLAEAEQLLSGTNPPPATADGRYTLGRIREACGQPRAALRLYREVLGDATAPQATVELVRAALMRLGQPDTAPAADRGAKPMTAEEAQRAAREAISRGRSAADNKQRPAAVAGWFVSAAMAGREEGPKCGGTAKPIELLVRDLVPGGNPEVLLRCATTAECISAPVVTTTETTTWLVVAGLGASSKPSATGAIPVGMATREEELDDDKKVIPHGKTKVSCQANFSPAGELALSCAPGAVPAGLDALLGSHQLRFP